MSVTLTEDNFLLYAAKHYNNPSCTGLREFEGDLRRFRYVTRLFNRYRATGKIPERLVLNHLVCLRNVFEEAFIDMVFFRTEEKHWVVLKTFLVFLHYIPDDYVIRENIRETDIPLDPVVVGLLRKI